MEILLTVSLALNFVFMGGFISLFILTRIFDGKEKGEKNND